MENTQTTRKWTELRGMAVVTLDDGKKVGTCDDFYFDLPTHRVYALRVRTGLLGHKVLPVSGINAIGQDAITTASGEELGDKLNDAQASNLASGQALLAYKIMSANGTLVGTIGNVLLDVSSPSAPGIAAIELAGGLRERLGGRYPSFPASMIQSYGHDVLVIPEELAQTLG
jgi:uncharacterized protein YrrD